MSISVRGSLAAAFFLPIAVIAQSGRIVGTAVDPSGSVLAGVQISLENTNRIVLTNASGQYVFANVGLGAYSVRASRQGHVDQRTQVSVQTASAYTVNFTLLRVSGATRLINVQNVAKPLPPDSVKLPAPDSAIMRRRQADRLPAVPMIGQRMQLPLFPDATFAVEIEEFNRTPTGFRANGRVLGRDGVPGSIVMVGTGDLISANIRYGLRLFLIRPQARGVQLVIEVDQSKIPGASGLR